jgi:PTS system glucose-specific IIC component
VQAPPAAGVVSKLRDPDAARKVAAWIAALGGAANIQRVDGCAETRLRIIVHDMAGVDENGLTKTAIDAVVRLPNNIVHLLVGLNADQYAAEMRGQLALPLAA